MKVEITTFYAISTIENLNVIENDDVAFKASIANEEMSIQCQYRRYRKRYE